MKYTSLWIPILLFSILGADANAKNKAPSKENRKIAQIDTIPLEDTVFRLKDQDQTTLVYFSMHAGVYSINKKSKNYSQMLEAVNKSKDSEKPVKVIVNVNTLEIQEITSQTQPSQE